MVLVHYDKPFTSESDVRLVLDMDSHYEAVEAESPDEAVGITEERFAYNKQYFEPLFIKAIEIHESILNYSKNKIIKKYSEVGKGEEYRVISEDIFIKGKEDWRGNGDWDVILK
jgi:hypothetical protein